MDWKNVLADYAHAVLPYWWALLVGAVMPFFDLLKWHGHELKVPRWLRLSITVAAIFIAQFLAYRDSLRNFDQVKQEKSNAISEREEMKSEVTKITTQRDDLLGQLAAKDKPIILQLPQKHGERMAVMAWVDPQPNPADFLVPNKESHFKVGYLNSGQFEARKYRNLFAIKVADTPWPIDQQKRTRTDLAKLFAKWISKTPGVTVSPGAFEWATMTTRVVSEDDIQGVFSGKKVIAILGQAYWEDSSGPQRIDQCFWMQAPRKEPGPQSLVWHECD